MALAPLRTEEDWADEILEAVKAEFNGEVQIVKPGKPGKLDAAAGTRTGGTPDQVIIPWRPARAQHLRTPLEQSGSAEWATKRRYRFQLELRAGDPTITKGLIARFRGGRDATLVDYIFQVVAASNSSHAALRTIEATTEFGVVGQ